MSEKMIRFLYGIIYTGIVLWGYSLFWARDVLLYIVSVYCIVLILQSLYFITKCQKALEAERKTATRMNLYESIIEEAPLSIVITDKNANIQYANQFFTSLTGFTAQETIGQNPSILQSGKTKPEVFHELWQTLSEGKAWHGEFINRKKTGEEYIEYAEIFPMMNNQKEVIHYVAFKSDVGERKQEQQKLLDQFYFTSQLLDFFPYPVFYANLQDNNRGCNKAYAECFALDRTQEIPPLPELSYLTTEFHALLKQMKQEALDTGKTITKRIRRKFANGEYRTILYSLSLYYLADHTPGGYIGILIDIEEMKLREEELKLALQKAEQAERIKAQFLANMSHEIRTPMNAVIGMAYLAMRTELNPKQRDYVGKIHQSATALLGIINDILDISKIEAGKIAIEHMEFNLSNMIHDTVSYISQQAKEKGLAFHCLIDPSVPRKLKGDPLRLGEIISNLISNAVKFTEAGEIRIVVRCLERQTDQVELQFEVSDTGIGMTKEQLDHIFDAFVQADNTTTRRFGGTGLGLAISKGLAELMGGTLEVDSIEHKGSTFLLTLRLGVVEETQKLGVYADQHSAVLQNEYSLEGYTVLLAEDNSINQQIIIELLQNQGMVVDATDNGRQAVQLFQSMPANKYQLVLLDLQMPELDGYETAKQIRLLDSKIPILAMSARSMAEEKEKCFAVGMNAHIAKPVDVDLLFATMAKWLHQANGIPYLQPDLIQADEAMIELTEQKADQTAPLLQPEELHNLLRLLQESDMEAIECFHEIRMKLRSILPEASFLLVDRSMNRFDFELAKQTLEHSLDGLEN